MDVDFSVELGTDDPILTVPWSAPECGLHYVDLKLHPELLVEVEEVRSNAEFGEFLVSINHPDSNLESAKCDAWYEAELGRHEQIEAQIYEATEKCGSYVDIFFSRRNARSSFEQHEDFARQTKLLLEAESELAARVELNLRRAYFESEPDAELEEGFYFTCYVFGYGRNEDEARSNWASGLRFCQKALLRAATTIPAGRDRVLKENGAD